MDNTGTYSVVPSVELQQHPLACTEAFSKVVLWQLIAFMATFALSSGLWVRRLLIGGSSFQGWCSASESNDGNVKKNQIISVRINAMSIGMG